jgi:hypothetical protein
VAAEAEEGFDLVFAVERAEHAREVAGRGDLRAEAAPKWFAARLPAEVVVAAGANRLGGERELAGARLDLDHRAPDVSKLESFP